MMEKCNIALEQAGYKPVTSKVTILKDLEGIENDFPEAIIVKRKIGRNLYYEYEDKSFSIYNIPLNDDEMAQLAQTISILSRFEGMPNFDWIDDFIEHFKSTLNIPSTRETIVAFDENYDLKGRNWFGKRLSEQASDQINGADGQQNDTPIGTNCDHVGDQVQRLVNVIREDVVTMFDLQKRLNIASRRYLRVNLLTPAIAQGYVMRAFPDKPNHPKQRYYLSEKGLKLVK